MSEESPRLRRLRLDSEKIFNCFSGSTAITIVEASGYPPEKYTIEYKIRGVYADASGKIHERDTHRLEINLSLGYPRRAPQCKMVTPIFHPNFDETSVCIGDFWAPSEGLDDLIIRIGRMIAYQEYNIKSPLNGLAAKWADNNSSQLPVDNTELAPRSIIYSQDSIEKIVVSITEDTVVATDLESFFNEAISGDDTRFAPKPRYPRLDFGSISILLNENKTTIGRSIGNTVMIPQDGISSNHAEIICKNDFYTFRDLSSTNGSYINNAFINEAILAHGDKIIIGNIEALFLLH